MAEEWISRLEFFSRWIYLEPILSSEGTFSRLDREWRQIGRAIESDPRLSALVARLAIFSPLLENLTQQLHKCQATLQEYIAEKRSIFPRLYFLSDDDLLELAGSSREVTLQAHVKKLFPGCTGLQLGPQGMSVTALVAKHGQRLVLDAPVDIDTTIEVWLKNLEEAMKASLRTCVLQCLRVRSGSDTQDRDMMAYPTQVLGLVQSILFTQLTEKAIVQRNLHSVREQVKRQVSELSSLERDGDLEVRSKVEAMLLQHNHHLDVLDELINNSVASLDNWIWMKQLRFYMEKKSDIIIRMGLAEVPYTYEYLGPNTGNLVRTKLTEECFFILMQALQLGQAGNPFGPAGTGKTESVKALGGLLGRLVLVFNCDEGMDNTTLGRLLTGLALSGSWGCFDEFNRLEEHTLAGATQHFTSLLKAISQQGKEVEVYATLNQAQIPVVSGCGVFVTMNPVGGGYGGRRVLPSALSSLLRPIAMCHPHYTHIARALLASQAPTHASLLANKLVTCFHMASTQLSPLHHYDWGLRALKTVIGSCGSALQHSNTSPDLRGQLTQVVKALRLNTYSKLSYDDSKIFDKLVKMVFPDAEMTHSIPDDIHQALSESYKALNLIYNEKQVEKCIQLYEQLKQRMGVVVVGPPGSGKTTIRLLLKHALGILGQNMSQHIICPKAMSRTDLLGYLDADTRQWNDGVMSASALTVASQPTDVWSWITCDGDVDPEWIESLNSVLDDNRLLTLPSGWRIQFGDNVNFVFETHTLEHASPATITRMGIILLSENECCSSEVITCWVRDGNVPMEWREHITQILETNISKALEWAASNGEWLVMPRFGISLVRQVLSLVRVEEVSKLGAEEHIAGAVAMALTSVTHSNLYEDVIQKVSEWSGISSHLLLWSKCSLQDTSLSYSQHSDRFLCTSRIQTILDTAQTWLDSFQHFMLIGPPASGKSLVVEHLLKEVSDYKVINLQCTPVFNHHHIIRALKQNSVVSLGGNKSGVRAVLVIRSLHRAKQDSWKSSLIQSFLLQMIQHNGFWERVDGGGLRWVSLGRFLLIITASSSFQPCPRLSNAMHTAYLKNPDDRELSDICSLHLSTALKQFTRTEKDKQTLQTLSGSMFSLYQKCSEIFNSEVHYKWSPRDLTVWCENLNNYKVDTIQDMPQIIYEEAVYIFRDRLISDSDVKTFESLALQYLGSSAVSQSQQQCYLPRMGASGIVMELVEYADYVDIVDRVINQCNAEVDTEGAGAFGESGCECCPELLSLCSRAGRSVGRWSVMCGVSGVGRRAAVRIAASVVGAKCLSVNTQQQFQAQIKNIITWCGDGVATILVVEERAAQCQEVLGALESLRGGVPPLEPGDMEALLQGGNRTLQSFTQNIVKYLGVVLLFDINDKNLKNTLESNCLLYERCHMVWMDGWSEETVKQMPALVIKRILSKNPGLEMDLDSVPMNSIYDLYTSIKQQELMTPYRFVMLLKSYMNFYHGSKASLEEKRKQLQAGVTALTNAQSEVSRLKAEAAEQEKALDEKQSRANQALNQIAATMQSATKHKEELQILQKNIEQENKKLSERKKEIEVELSEVEPVILEARAAVGDIRPESLSEVRSLRAPPEPVRDVLEGVLRLMDIADTSWHSMKQFLSKRGIKEDIRTFDASNISKENLAAVEKLVSSKQASFTEKTAKRASVACAPLAAWVLANIKYAHVLHKIAPLESEQRALTKNLDEIKAQMMNLSSGLSSVDDRVAGLKDQLSTYTKEATEIEIRLASAQQTISKAETLVSRLDSEFHRWQTNLEELNSAYDEVSVRSLLAAAYITYLSNETEDQREKIVSSWCQGMGVRWKEFTLKDFMRSPDAQLQWIHNGLPSDTATLNNATILNETLKEVKNGLVPLVIDPSGMVAQWLKKQFSSTPMDFVYQHGDKFNMSLQHAVRFGKRFIIEETTMIDDNWGSLLRGQIPSGMVGISNINPMFRLILFCRDANVISNIQPHHRALVSVIDFTPQLHGLIDQFVYHAVKQEEPELQEELSRITSEKHALQTKQFTLQMALLNQLSSGDILNNTPLLQSLQETQHSSQEIDQALQKAADLSAAIEGRCSQYRSIATRTAKVYLAVSTVSRKHPLAVQNINCVVPLFLKTLASHRVTKGSSGIDEHSVCKEITVGILERVLVALQKEYHCSVTMFLLHLIYPEHIPQQEWDVLVSIMNTQTHGDGQQVPSWVPEDRYLYLHTLKNELPEVYTRYNLSSYDSWVKFSTSGEWDDIPANINVTPFQKVLLFWAVKPDKLYSACLKAISAILGVSQVYPEGDLLSVVESWGSPSRPIIVVGSPGTDPIDQIRMRASNVVGEHNHKQVWISQDLSGANDQNLKTSLEWVLSSEGWLTVVSSGGWSDAALQGLMLSAAGREESDGATESKCRVWIVAEDVSKVPSLLVSHCINVIMEPPSGIKSNLLRMLSLWAPHTDRTGDTKAVHRCRLEFSLALTHSVIQERAAYIPQGWRSNYGFSSSDAEACVAGVRLWCRGEPSGGLCGAVYSARVTCSSDAHLARTLVSRNFNEDVLGHKWKPLGLNITLPNSPHLKEYLLALSQFPSNDLPSHLGLANNIHRAREQTLGNNLMKQLKSYNHSDVSIKYDAHVWKKMLASILSLWKKLNSGPDSLVKANVNDIKFTWDENDLVRREWEMAVKVVRVVHGDLSQLRSGQVDATNRDVAESLLEDKTPLKWLSLWEGAPLMASCYLSSLTSRASCIRRLSVGPPKGLPPPTTLLAPHRLLNSLLWMAAHKHSTPPEDMVLVTHWGKEDSGDASEEDKLALQGLILEGAEWNGGKLCPCRANTPPQTPAPPITLQYTPTSGNTTRGDIEIPIYTSPERTHLVFRVGVPHSDQFNTNLWLLNSTALIIP